MVDRKWALIVVHLPGQELLEQDDFARRVDVGLAVGHRVDEQVTGREPGVGVVVELLDKFRSSEKRSFFKQSLLEVSSISIQNAQKKFAHIDGLRISCLIPPWVQGANAAGEVGTAAILGVNIRRVLRDTVVDSVNSLNEFLRYREPQFENDTSNPTLYIFNHRTLTLESLTAMFVLFPMTSWPKCL